MPAKAGAVDASVQGQIFDSGSRAPVSLAEVELIGTALRTTTDKGGRFALHQVPPGVYSLKANRVGYEPVVQENISVEPGAAVDLPLEMRRIVTLIEEITVTPGSFSFMGQGTGTRQTMSREDVQAVPQIGDDIFRAVNRLPGLASNDYSAHFGIRGGRHDETLILLDGLELYEPYHLKDFNEGAISIIDAETIDGVQLMTGGFPARYGNKRSGVFDITSRTPEPDRTHIDVGVSVMNTRVMGSGPFAERQGLVAGVRPRRLHGPGVPVHRPGRPAQARLRGRVREGELQAAAKPACSRSTPARGRQLPSTTSPPPPASSTRSTPGDGGHRRYGNSYVWSHAERSTLGSRTTVRTMLSAGSSHAPRDGSERDVARWRRSTRDNDRTYSTVRRRAGLDATASPSRHPGASAWTSATSTTPTPYQTIVYGIPTIPSRRRRRVSAITNTRFDKRVAARALPLRSLARRDTRWSSRPACGTTARPGPATAT